MRSSVDVFVIGGGPAGLAAAIAARMRGLSVIVADGAEPPIDKSCGEGLMPGTIEALRSLGVNINAAEGFTFRGIRFVEQANPVGSEMERVTADFPAGQGIGLRRLVLHQKLIERAEQAGVDLQWKTCVTGVGPRGVVIGGRKAISARWVVGADGMRSRVRRWAGLDRGAVPQPRYAFRRHFRVAPWSDCMEVYWGRDVQAYVTPVSADEVCVVLLSRKPGVRTGSIPMMFPRLAERLTGAGESRERGELTLTHSFSRLYRGRVALVGDASGTVDAITGEGLCLSFQQALALAAALERGDLRVYQREHRRLARRPALMSRLLLTLERRPAWRRRVLQLLAAHPELFARLVAVHVGSASPGHVLATGALLGWRFVTP